MNTKLVSSIAALLLVTQGAFADVITTELGDAGESLATAQAVDNGTTTINGLGGLGDADMFGFIWGGGALTIDTFGPFGFDTQLFLFDELGFGVLGNDDHGGACAGTPGSAFQSCLNLASLAAGQYFLGISTFNNDPFDSSNVAMMSCASFSSQCVASGGALDYWRDSPTSGNESRYAINFSSAVSVPEPGTLALLGIGLFGMGLARRRKTV